MVVELSTARLRGITFDIYETENIDNKFDKIMLDSDVDDEYENPYYEKDDFLMENNEYIDDPDF